MKKGGLFPRLAFSPDETHASWAERLAAYHTGGGVNEFLNDLRIPVVAFLTGHAEFVQDLCHIADQDPKPVLQNTIFRASPSRYSLGNEVFCSRLLMGKLTKFCPMCLLEDDAQGGNPRAGRREHLSWRFRSTLVCQIHNIYLMTFNTPSALTSDLPERRPFCPERLQIMTDHSEAAIPSPVQSYLLGRFAGEPGPEWLDGQQIDQAVRATEILGAVLAFGFRVDIDKMSAEDCHRAACVGWEWTSKGETGLREAFTLLQTAGPMERRGAAAHPGYKFGTLYRWLSSKHTHDDRGPIKNVLREHMIQTEAITTSQKILGVAVPKNHIQRHKTARTTDS
jgi:hypothetical protein